MNNYHFSLSIRGSIADITEFERNLPRTNLEEGSFTFQMEHYIPAGGNHKDPSPAIVKKRRELWGTTSDISVAEIKFRPWMSSNDMQIVIKGSTNAHAPILFCKSFGKMNPHLKVDLSFLSYSNNSSGFLMIRKGEVFEYRHVTGDDVMFQAVESNIYPV